MMNETGRYLHVLRVQDRAFAMIEFGSVCLKNNVALAPMSGVTDLPMRRAAARAGAGMVVSEMVASEQLASGRPETILRAAGDSQIFPFVVQLAGREEKWMQEGARLACAAGADVIDINMGCPSRQVTGALSGSALMRDPDHAVRLVRATLEGAGGCAVTVKMRLGWDHEMLTAPLIIERARALGVAGFSVHGRTRAQFYKGVANWAAIRTSVSAAGTQCPVLVNGDIISLEDARRALELSGAAGVMIGRAAEGRPWLPGAIADALQNGRQRLAEPSLDQQGRIAITHYQETIAHYEHSHHGGRGPGQRLGVRMARKHLAKYVELCPVDLASGQRKALKSGLCRLTCPDMVLEGLYALYAKERSLRDKLVSRLAA